MSVLIHNHMLGQTETDVKLESDFIGFTYNGKHSSDLGIVRVSEGSRFNENLLPTMQDKTVQVPGGDGTYYFGSYFTQRQIPVSFAFDSLTEEQIAALKAHFGDKKIHDLVFDERPYKTWRAKVTGTATLKYLAFSEGETNRLYKGEGTIQFTCYQPYAICEKKWLSDYSSWANIDEWKSASRMKNSSDNYYDVFIEKLGIINVYNAGDIESHFQIKIDFSGPYEIITFNEEIPYKKGKYYIKDSQGKYIISEEEYKEGEEYYTWKAVIPKSKMYISGDASKQLAWKEFAPEGKDVYVKFNSRLNLIEGYDADNRKTGNVYNKYITEGAFFKIPLGESTLVFDKTEEMPQIHSIEYNYYYI